MQLFKIVPCPRHRLPVFDPKTGLLRPKDAPDWNLVNLMLQVGLNTDQVIHPHLFLRSASNTAAVTALISNINMSSQQVTGNTTENILCIRILIFQAVCCALGFLVRWLLAGVYK